MKQYFKYIEKSEDNYNVVFYNGVDCGNLIRDVDGYFMYFPKNNGGGLESWSMKLIAEKLDELNKPWDEYVRTYMPYSRSTNET